MPLVSVVVPVFNGEKYIAEALDSALAQDHPRIEIIVVNDGSTDGTLTALEPYRGRVRVIDQVNSGPSTARNAGLDAARGDYIAFLDADDVWLQGKLSAQVRHLENRPEDGACYFEWFPWAADADGQFRRPDFATRSVHDAELDPIRSGWIYARLLLDCELLTTTVMLRATVARRVGHFDTGFWTGEDYDYWLRVSQVSTISRLTPAGALYRVVSGSMSRRARPINDELLVIDTALARFGRCDPSGLQVSEQVVAQRRLGLLVQHGYTQLKFGDPTLALDALGQALRARPWQPRLWLHCLEAWWRKGRRAFGMEPG